MSASASTRSGVPLERMPDVRDGGIDHIGGGDPLPVDADRGRVDARHVEDVLEQARQPVELGDGRAGLRATLVGRQIAAQVLDGHADRRQRRSAGRGSATRAASPRGPPSVGRAPPHRARPGTGPVRSRSRRRPRPRRACRCRVSATTAASSPTAFVPCRSGTIDTSLLARRHGCGRRTRAGGRRTPACRAPSPAPCSARRRRWRRPRCRPGGSASRDRPAGRSPPWTARSDGRRVGPAPRWRSAVSVVSSTSRVRSNRRVTSLRRAIASRARSCAAADRLLAMTATIRKANSAIQFCGSAIVKAPTGGRKKKFSVSIATTDTTTRDPQAREGRGAEHDQQQRQSDRRGTHVRNDGAAPSRRRSRRGCRGGR